MWDIVPCDIAPGLGWYMECDIEDDIEPCDMAECDMALCVEAGAGVCARATDGVAAARQARAAKVRFFMWHLRSGSSGMEPSMMEGCGARRKVPYIRSALPHGRAIDADRRKLTPMCGKLRARP